MFESGLHRGRLKIAAPLGVGATRIDRPSTINVEVSCSSLCTTSAGGNTAPYKYYKLAGEKTYQSIIIPAMTFNAEMKVQVR